MKIDKKVLKVGSRRVTYENLWITFDYIIQNLNFYGCKIKSVCVKCLKWKFCEHSIYTANAHTH